MPLHPCSTQVLNGIQADVGLQRLLRVVDVLSEGKTLGWPPGLRRSTFLSFSCSCLGSCQQLGDAWLDLAEVCSEL